MTNSENIFRTNIPEELGLLVDERLIKKPMYAQYIYKIAKVNLCIEIEKVLNEISENDNNLPEGWEELVKLNIQPVVLK